MPEDTRSQVDQVLDSKDDEVILRQALQLYKASSDAVEEKQAKWERHLGLYDSTGHWKGVNWSNERSRLTINLCQSFVEATVAALTDNRPEIFVQPDLPEDTQLAYDLEQAVHYILDQQNFDLLRPKTVRSAVAIGNGFVKPFFNPFVKTGGVRGQIELGPMSAFSLYPDPMATTLQTAGHVGIVHDLPYDWLLENYPEQAKDVQAGEWDLKLHATKYMEGGENDGTVPIAGTAGSAWLMPTAKGTGDSLHGMGQKLRGYELYVRESANIIRRFLLCNGKVLENEPFGVPDILGGFIHFKEYPLIHYFYRPTEWNFFAEGLLQALEGLQLELNKVRSLMMDHLMFGGAGAPWILGASNHDTVIDNAFNAKIKVTDIAQIKKDQPVPIPNALFQHAEMIRYEMETITGHVEILQGRRPVGIESGKALDTLTEQANTRVRQHARYTESSDAQLGKMLIDYIAAYWTEDRLIRVLGPNGEKTWKKINGLRFRGHEFHVTVKSGSTLPFSRQQLMSEAIELHEIGAFGEPGTPKATREVLKARNWPNYEKIYEENKIQRQELLKEQAALAQGAVPGDPGAVGGAAPGQPGVPLAAPGTLAQPGAPPVAAMPPAIPQPPVVVNIPPPPPAPIPPPVQKLLKINRLNDDPYGPAVSVTETPVPV